MRPPSFLCCAGCGKLALLKIFGRRHRCRADSNNNNNATGRNVSAREPPAEGGGRIRGGQGASEGRDAQGGRRRRPMGPRTRAKRESNALQRVVGRKRPKGPRPYIQREFLARA